MIFHHPSLEKQIKERNDGGFDYRVRKVLSSKTATPLYNKRCCTIDRYQAVTST
jgi:hypothetical protein